MIKIFVQQLPSQQHPDGRTGTAANVFRERLAHDGPVIEKGAAALWWLETWQFIIAIKSYFTSANDINFD